MLKLLPPMVFIFLATAGFTSCDQEGKKDCNWVLEAEPNLIGKVSEGYIPVCARNRNPTKMKQDCRLQTTLEEAKRYAGRKFRYVDMKVESPALPRTIVSIEFCD